MDQEQCSRTHKSHQRKCYSYTVAKSTTTCQQGPGSLYRIGAASSVRSSPDSIRLFTSFTTSSQVKEVYFLSSFSCLLHVCA